MRRVIVIVHLSTFLTIHAFIVRHHRRVHFGFGVLPHKWHPLFLAGMDEQDVENGANPNNVNIPKTGVSLGDQIMESQTTQYSTELVSWSREQPGLAKIVTTPPFQPTRYIVPLYSNQTLQQSPHLHPCYVMVDIPPFSVQLAEKISSFIRGESGETSRLVAILVTCRDGIHYDQSPAVYVTRKSHVQQWKDAFPGLQVIMYRLETPRDCRDAVTQQLDGYGPWAWDPKNGPSFVETGRPLTRIEWNETIRNKVLDMGETPPDEYEEYEKEEDKDLYGLEQIRKRELHKAILAVYTPGHSFGSLVYVFPNTLICCSGYTLPLEDNRSSSSGSMTGSAGPMLDYRGYVTNAASIPRQVESGRHIIRIYGDRFHTILPSMGVALFLQDKSVEERQGLLEDALVEWQELGRIYQDLGIV